MKKGTRKRKMARRKPNTASTASWATKVRTCRATRDAGKDHVFPRWW